LSNKKDNLLKSCLNCRVWTWIATSYFCPFTW
jgi:hypothetical protein